MASKRQEKFARVIQKALAEIFQYEGFNFLPNVLITITKATVTPDLSLARIYLSFFNHNNATGALDVIKMHASDIRYKLGHKLKDQVKTLPRLEFFVDDTHEYVEHLDKIFNKMGKTPPVEE